ncbi:hypothetical protein [Aquibaculum sediminis]|uniref:hypothetical protein n=1 Tax=Aquibaculum sediminis TaxID=3231907 RepID=UPI00345156D3
MAALLLLGSKPEPVLPPAGAWQALACANASGRSAQALGLADPDFTVISAIVTSGRKPANYLAVTNLAGLYTKALYYLPRPVAGSTALKRALFPLKMWRCQPWFFRRRLGAAGYRWDRFHNPGYAWYLEELRRLTGGDETVMAAAARKQPSTGAFALVVALSLGRWDRVILSGFSFELTHAYAHNPSIEEMGTTASKHGDTDIKVMRSLAEASGRVVTTEAAVAEGASIAYL